MKAHPATPYHPRPYPKGISPKMMESLVEMLIDRTDRIKRRLRFNDREEE